jgi:hypothetical protein
MYHTAEAVCLSLLAGVFLASIGSAGADEHGVVISEVMANVAGRESGSGSPGDRNEFIELHNRSEQSADLSEWIISDGDADDRIEAWVSDEHGEIGDPDVVTGITLVPPDGYAVILDREYVITDSMSDDPEPYDLPQNTIVLTVGNTTLGDGLSTTDPIVLALPDGTPIDSYGTPLIEDDTIPYDPGDGVSMERLDPWLGDFEWNWAPSSAPSGSTPGAPNASAILVDLAVVTLTADPPALDLGENVALIAHVANSGREMIDEYEVTFFSDFDLDHIEDPGEEIATLAGSDSLDRGDTATVVHEWHPEAAGGEWIGARAICPGDEDSANDVATTFIIVGRRGPGLVINEIMFQPLASGSEWIELFNSRPQEVSLSGWRIEDADSARGRELPYIHLASKSYTVLVDDHTSFTLEHPDVPAVAVPEGGLPSLDDSGDIVRLRDDEGRVIDSLTYEGGWGGGRGISLERINPVFPSDDPDNWAPSVARRGSTPGERNSIFLSDIPRRSALTVSPNPFSPDGDGRLDHTVIAFKGPALRLKVRLHIFDAAGRLVRKLLEQETTGGEGTAVWDGRDDKGRILPVGIYIVHLEGIDEAGGRLVEETCTVVLAARL